MGVDAQWTWSDAWVFAAIRLADPRGEGARLADVVAVGDAINHAIFRVDEVEGGVRRLLGAGLVAVASERYLVTRAGRDIDPPRRDLLSWVDSLLDALRGVPATEVAWSLEPTALDAAYQEWHREADRYLNPKPRRAGRRDDPCGTSAE